MKYELSRAAQRDVEDIYYRGIEEFGQQIADEYFDGLAAYLENLVLHPIKGVAVDDIRTGYRRSIYQKNSIYYQLKDDNIYVVRILGRQDPQNQLSDNA